MNEKKQGGMHFLITYLCVLIPILTVCFGIADKTMQSMRQKEVNAIQSKLNRSVTVLDEQYGRYLDISAIMGNTSELLPARMTNEDDYNSVYIGLEVLKDATAQAIADAKALLAAGKVSVKIQEPCDEILFSRAKVWNGEKWACVTIVGGHTNIVHIETHDGVVFTQQACVAEGEQESPLTVLSRTTLAEILKFVNEVPFAAIRFILDSAKLNCALSQEGLSGKWGLHIGATLEKQCERGLLAKDLSSSIVIRTSAASDARMGGATLPAMSNSGSGNQGITATMPVVVVAEHFGADDERLARALMLSHLSAIYIHNQLPRLSALCAATTAAMGAAAGMAWLVDGRYETISMAISSMIGDVSGMICDGASNSCAMKVSTSASAAWKAVLMALDDTAVTGNEGIVAHDVEQSIANLCALASHSMQQTDRQIIEIMASKAR